MAVKPTADRAQLETLRKRIAWALCSLWNYHLTRRFIKKLKPDVIYLHNIEWITSSPLSAAAESGVRVVIHLHNHAYHDLWESVRTGSARGGIRKLFHLTPNFGSARLIAVSQAIAGEFIDRGYSPDRVHTIHNGLPKGAFGAIPSPAERKNVICVGEIEPHKGVDIAINTVGDLRDRGVSLFLDIIGPSGNSGYRASLDAIIAARSLQGQVRFLGALPRETVWEKMRSAEMLLFPAVWQEPFGLVAAEAMAGGAYVIASNRGALPEVLGQCGSLVEPTPAACAEAVLRYSALTSEEKETMRGAARARALSLFSLDNAITLIEQELLRENHA